ncbi:hypothetical protein CKA32_003381 [Geitlerinema sp. FC II]|nr:hypothetical protein CKA32_003381 [Geitlerinema sp. FC II]
MGKTHSKILFKDGEPLSDDRKRHGESGAHRTTSSPSFYRLIVE